MFRLELDRGIARLTLDRSEARNAIPLDGWDDLRVPSASPATGSYAIHSLEQEKIVNDALIEETDEISAASEPEVSEKIAPAGA